ncbi:MAG: PAS domain-containing sensor histidine kinase [Thermoanaerobaculia bacterium]
MATALLVRRWLPWLVLPVVLGATGAALTSVLGQPAWVVGLVALAAGLVGAVASTSRLASHWSRATAALSDGVKSLRAGDFSSRLVIPEEAALADLVRVHNELADALANERGAIRRRELLLDGALEASPAAVLLIGSNERILYANRAARILFHGGRRLEGHAFEELGADGPEALRVALAEGGDALVTAPFAEGEETFQIHQRQFELDSRRQRLVLVRRLTAELRRQEVAGWKKGIRIIGHEVRSHLSAIRSLSRSAKQLELRGDRARIPELLDDIDQAGEALQRFIDGYGRFAKLPEPRREEVELRSFLAHLARAEPFRVDGEVPAIVLSIDPGQIQQVLTNLLKNAREAGGPPEEVMLAARLGGADLELEVVDRGSGMDEETLSRALLPFFSTKADGGGLGLAICREILEAHGGSLRLEPRRQGGLRAICRLPLAGGDGVSSAYQPSR